MYSRIAVFAREYKLIRFRVQKVRIVANSFFPKTVTIRCKEPPRGGRNNWRYMNLSGSAFVRQS
jgi:hypothetical protein